MLTFETSATIPHTLAVAFGGARQALWLTLLTSEGMKCQVLTPHREVHIINNTLFSLENLKLDFIAFN